MEVAGRAREIGMIGKWLDSGTSGPWMAVLSGDVGIGKSTIWSTALEVAAGRSYQVLSCRSDESETGLAYAGLGDLVNGVEGSAAVRGLREPLRRALATALWWEQPEGEPPSRRAVAMAVLDLVRRLSAERPVLIALDDLQWLDSATEVVLAFVLRRLTVEPVKLLATLRTGPDGDAWPALARVLPAERVTRWEAGPLSPDALAAVVEGRYGTALTRPLLRRLHEACGGNPLFGLEMARAWAERSDPAAAMSLPESLRHRLRQRVSALSPAAAEAALLVACASRPTIGLVETVTGGLEGLAETTSEWLVSLDGEVPRFRNPLFGVAVLEVAGPLRRRDMHVRLARVVDDPEERARHLAATAGEPDAEVADTLDDAATLAATRGAPLVAGEMAMHAARLTPSGQADIGLRRQLAAAAHLISGGDGTRARALLEDALRRCPPGPGRAEVFFLLGRAIFNSGDIAGSIVPLQWGRAEIAGHPELLVPITASLTYFCMHLGDLAAALGHARELLTLAEGTGDRATRDDAVIVLATLEFMCNASAPVGLPVPARARDRDRAPLVALHMYGYLCRCLGDLPAAKAAFATLRAAVAETGTEASAEWGMVWAAEVECLAGDLKAAARYADLAAHAVQETGVPSSAALFAEALVLSLRGELDRARRLAGEGLSVAHASGHRTAALTVRALLGFIDLSGDDPMAAVLHLDAADQMSSSLGAVLEVVCPTAGADHVEALVLVGRYDQAAERAERMQRAVRAIDQPLARGLAGRARGVLLTATGSPKRGVAELEAAAAEFSTAGMPFELARTLLALGRSQNRLRRREAARRSMERAGRIFTELGAEGWAERAVLRSRLSTPNKLTVSEAPVVALAAEGRTNQEIADELAIGVKTVESHLSSAYRKLGVRSRTELVVRLTADRRGAGQD
ncbi:helix-turn-helix transcriptional regulator [Sphaerisporangium corydalis]|uniref:AAA family ATPase n=1 Tax=Sphaerisporangium corydalis TaxID=1441875 RepID=A0ABV9EGB9_9ACTN|nr:LuxR family transcriptional regulator [Sphaerisporangium corydalis]